MITDAQKKLLSKMLHIHNMGYNDEHKYWNLIFSHKTQFKINSKYHKKKSDRECIWVKTNGRPCNDFNYQEESLYRYKDGTYFLVLEDCFSGQPKVQLFDTQVYLYFWIISRELHDLSDEYLKENCGGVEDEFMKIIEDCREFLEIFEQAA